jgi:NADH-quinone oxidoreductase subunit C
MTQDRRIGVLPESLIEHPIASPLDQRFPGAIVEGNLALGEVSLFIDPARILEVCGALKQDFSFEQLTGVTCVDWWPQEPRFEVVYQLHSLSKNTRLRLKVRISGNDALDSVTPVWLGANWYEREVFDLFGVTFRNHPDLERIMMPVDWEGHPLRKDYPVHGYRYSYADE